MWRLTTRWRQLLAAVIALAAVALDQYGKLVMDSEGFYPTDHDIY